MGFGRPGASGGSLGLTLVCWTTRCEALLEDQRDAEKKFFQCLGVRRQHELITFDRRVFFLRRSFKAVFLVVIRCTAHCHLQCASANLANSASHKSFNRLFFAEFGNKNPTHGGRRVAFRRMNILCEGHHGSGRLEGWVVSFLMQVEQANCASAHDDTLVGLGPLVEDSKKENAVDLDTMAGEAGGVERTAWLSGTSSPVCDSNHRRSQTAAVSATSHAARPSASSVLSRRHVTI